MYAWRKWNLEMREQVLAHRQLHRRPWHGPPHFEGQQTDQYLITGACYEHACILGYSQQRLDDFVSLLHDAFLDQQAVIHAWCLLPNHYHVLATVVDLRELISRLGRLHGRTSRGWNVEENKLERQCWHRATDRAMRSESHVWATVNYIHHNPVKHGYATQWSEWPWSSAHDYLQAVGREEAQRLWRTYPLGEYGKGWDEI